MRFLKRAAEWVKKSRRRIAEVGAGMTAYAVFNWFFNYPLYFVVVARCGLVQGGLIMFGLSLIQNIGLLYLYDRIGIDWVGARYLQEVQMSDGKRNWIQRTLIWALKEEARNKGHRLVQALVFIILSTFVDPFIVSVHYRHFQFLGVSRRDLKIITAAVVIGNVYWTLRTGILVAFVKTVWQWFS